MPTAGQPATAAEVYERCRSSRAYFAKLKAPPPVAPCPPELVRGKKLLIDPTWIDALDEDGKFTTGRVVRTVSRHFKLKPADVVSPTREKQYILARQVIAGIIRECSGLSLPAIGRVINRDHTSVMSGLTTLRKRLACDRELADEFAMLLGMCGGSLT